MTPAVKCLQKAKIVHTVHEYEHDADCTDYGDESVQKLNVSADRVFKTLVTDTPKGLAVCVVPVSKKLCLKAVACTAGVKKSQMADIAAAEKATGYIKGGISPLGQKKRLPVFLDQSALNHKTIFVSAGRRGLSLELNPEDLKQLTKSTVEILVV